MLAADVAGNDDPLDFRSTLLDFEQFLISVKHLDSVVFHQAVSAVDLGSSAEFVGDFWFW